MLLQFSRAIRNLALRASKLADASGLLMIRRSLSPSPVRQIHASMICRTNSGWLSGKSEQFSRAIRNLALRASELADASGLLMIRRSLSPSPVRQIHASMICQTNSGWLNCYWFSIRFHRL